MVSFLKNFALGAVSQLNKNEETKKESAVKQADEIRKARLQFSLQNELNKNTSEYQAKKEMEKLRYESDLKRQEEDRQRQMFMDMGGTAGMPVDTMPQGGNIQIPEQAPMASVDIDDPDTDPTTVTDDPEANAIISQYKWFLAKGQPDKALDARANYFKHVAAKEEKDPTKKGQNDATQLEAQAKAMRDAGLPEATIQSKVYGIKGPKEVSPEFVKSLQKDALGYEKSYQSLKDFQNLVGENKYALNALTRAGAYIGKLSGQTELTDTIMTKMGVTTPEERQAVQNIRSRANLMLGSMRGLIDSGVLSNQDKARLEATIPVLDTFTDPVAIESAINTAMEIIRSNWDITLNTMEDPSSGAMIKRGREALYGPQGKPNIDPDTAKAEAIRRGLIK